MKKIIRRKKVDEGFLDKVGAFGRGLADKATLGDKDNPSGYAHIRAAADFGVKTGLKKLGLKGGEDTTYQRELDQEKEKLAKDSKDEPLASGIGDTVGHVIAASPIGSAFKAVKAAVSTGKDYFNKAEPVVDKFERGLKEDENTDKVSDIANQFKAMASEPKVGIKKLPDINAPGVPDMFKVKKLQEEGTTSGGGFVAGLGVGDQGEPPRVKRGMFAGNETFKIPRQTYNSFLGKGKGHRKWWETYLKEEDDEVMNEIREFANKNPKAAIVFEDEDTGACFFARYGKKK